MDDWKCHESSLVKMMMLVSSLFIFIQSVLELDSRGHCNAFLMQHIHAVCNSINLSHDCLLGYV